MQLVSLHIFYRAPGVPAMGNGSYSRIDEQRQQQRRGGNILSKRYALFREKRPSLSPERERFSLGGYTGGHA